MTITSVVAIMTAISGGTLGKRIEALAPSLAYACARYRIDPIDLAAIAWHESHYDMGAVGKAGEIGAFQVAESSYETWCADTRHIPFHVDHKVLCGARLFARARRKCHAFPFTAYHTPSHCGPSEYETKIRATIERVTK
jgi:hypothetical protein